MEDRTQMNHPVCFASWRNSSRGRQRPNEESDINFFLMDFTCVAAHGVEEGLRPPLLPFERLLLTLVFPLPTLLFFQPLGLDLIFPNRILVARPVEVDHLTRA